MLEIEVILWSICYFVGEEENEETPNQISEKEVAVLVRIYIEEEKYTEAFSILYVCMDKVESWRKMR